jgi:hypothetical protein
LEGLLPGVQPLNLGGRTTFNSLGLRERVVCRNTRRLSGCVLANEWLLIVGGRLAFISIPIDFINKFDKLATGEFDSLNGSIAF